MAVTSSLIIQKFINRSFQNLMGKFSYFAQASVLNHKILRLIYKKISTDLQKGSPGIKGIPICVNTG